ncbi:MAG TPA: cupredoxin domain-containing protein [Actinomycetota bacterium]|nr:cupredoxin domain-containing protein [Actinomycetota bacterium]
MSLLGALFALTLLAASCGGEDTPTDADQGGGSPSESPADGGDGGGGADLTMVDFGFSPTELSVTEGQTISVTNIGETSHTFTTDDDAIDETIGAGETLEIPLTGVSSGGFHCRFHTQMTGTLTVG